MNTIRRCRRLVLPLLVVVLVLAPAAAADAKEKRAFESTWDCTEVAVSVPVPTAKARELVPGGFDIVEVQGQTMLALFAQECDTTVDGGKPFRHILSGAFFFVRDPGGSDELHAFDFLWGTDSRHYLGATKALGFGDFTPGTTFKVTSVGGQVHTTTAEVKWATSPFSVIATTGEPPTVRMPFTSVHWTTGSRGNVRGSYPHMIAAAPGRAQLQLTPGTLLADLVGADQASTVAVLFRFTITGGRTEIVD